MDIRVKERLTGAVILVALIVLVVPELLSGPARRTRQPQAAADEPPLRSVTLELGDEGRSSIAPRADRGGEPAASPSPPPTSASAESSASSSSPAPAAVPPPAPEAQAAQAARPGRSSAPVHTQHMARAEPRGPAPAPTTAGWSVQVGSFESRERADRLVHRLRAAGFTAFISETLSHGRKWYRVRVGPERDRGAARAMVARLHSAGHAGSLIPP